jgi:hypothetical protein
LLAIAFSSLLFLAALSPAVADCPNGSPHELKFKVKSDGCVEKVVKKCDENEDANDTHVHEGDTVLWKFTGAKKSVVFDSKSPFDWIDSGHKDNKIEGVVRAGALGDQPADGYKYSVTVEGMSCVLDPRIIVDP